MPAAGHVRRGSNTDIWGAQFTASTLVERRGDLDEISRELESIEYFHSPIDLGPARSERVNHGEWDGGHMPPKQEPLTRKGEPSQRTRSGLEIPVPKRGERKLRVLGVALLHDLPQRID